MGLKVFHEVEMLILTFSFYCSSSVKKETLLCGSRLPPTYYSESSNIEVVLKGFIHNQTSSISSFSAAYSSVFATKKPDPPCGELRVTPVLLILQIFMFLLFLAILKFFELTFSFMDSQALFPIVIDLVVPDCHLVSLKF